MRFSFPAIYVYRVDHVADDEEATMMSTLVTEVADSAPGPSLIDLTSSMGGGSGKGPAALDKRSLSASGVTTGGSHTSQSGFDSAPIHDRTQYEKFWDDETEEAENTLAKSLAFDSTTYESRPLGPTTYPLDAGKKVTAVETSTPLERQNFARKGEGLDMDSIGSASDLNADSSPACDDSSPSVSSAPSGSISENTSSYNSSTESSSSETSYEDDIERMVSSKNNTDDTIKGRNLTVEIDAGEVAQRILTDEEDDSQDDDTSLEGVTVSEFVTEPCPRTFDSDLFIGHLDGDRPLLEDGDGNDTEHDDECTTAGSVTLVTPLNFTMATPKKSVTSILVNQESLSKESLASSDGPPLKPPRKVSLPKVAQLVDIESERDNRHNLNLASYPTFYSSQKMSHPAISEKLNGVIENRYANLEQINQQLNNISLMPTTNVTAVKVGGSRKTSESADENDKEVEQILRRQCIKDSAGPQDLFGATPFTSSNASKAQAEAKVEKINPISEKVAEEKADMASDPFGAAPFDPSKISVALVDQKTIQTAKPEVPIAPLILTATTTINSKPAVPQKSYHILSLNRKSKVESAAVECNSKVELTTSSTVKPINSPDDKETDEKDKKNKKSKDKESKPSKLKSAMFTSLKSKSSAKSAKAFKKELKKKGQDEEEEDVDELISAPADSVSKEVKPGKSDPIQTEKNQESEQAKQAQTKSKTGSFKSRTSAGTFSVSSLTRSKDKSLDKVTPSSTSTTLHHKSLSSISNASVGGSANAPAQYEKFKDDKEERKRDKERAKEDKKRAKEQKEMERKLEKELKKEMERAKKEREKSAKKKAQKEKRNSKSGKADADEEEEGGESLLPDSNPLSASPLPKAAPTTSSHINSASAFRGLIGKKASKDSSTLKVVSENGSDTATGRKSTSSGAAAAPLTPGGGFANLSFEDMIEDAVTANANNNVKSRNAT